MKRARERYRKIQRDKEGHWRERGVEEVGKKGETYRQTER